MLTFNNFLTIHKGPLWKYSYHKCFHLPLVHGYFFHRIWIKAFTYERKNLKGEKMFQWSRSTCLTTWLSVMNWTNAYRQKFGLDRREMYLFRFQSNKEKVNHLLIILHEESISRISIRFCFILYFYLPNLFVHDILTFFGEGNF